MNSAEREVWISFVGDLVVKGWFGLKIWRLSAEGAFSGDAGMILWGKTVLWMIPVAIGVQIGLTILFAIGRGMLSHGRLAPDLVDERDRMIRQRGLVTGYFVTSAFMLGGVAALAMGQGVVTGLNLMLAGLMLSDLASNLVKAGHYRWGG